MTDTSASAEILNAAFGPAVRAIVERRIDQIVSYGHTRAADAARDPLRLLHEAELRLHDARDRIGCPEGREVALRKIEIVGAMMLALHDLISAEVMATDPKRLPGEAAPSPFQPREGGQE